MREKMRNHAKYMHKYKNKNVQYKLYFTHTIFSKFYLYLKNFGFSSSPPWKYYPSSSCLFLFWLSLPFKKQGERTHCPSLNHILFRTRWWKLAYVWGTNNFNMETFSWQKHLQHSHFELYKLSNISKKSKICWVS